MAAHEPMTAAELRAARALCGGQARFEEASRTLVPRLLDEIDWLRAEVHRLELAAEERRLERRLPYGTKIDPETDPLEAAKITPGRLRRELAEAIERNDLQKAGEIEAELRLLERWLVGRSGPGLRRGKQARQ